MTTKRRGLAGVAVGAATLLSAVGGAHAAPLDLLPVPQAAQSALSPTTKIAWAVQVRARAVRSARAARRAPAGDRLVGLDRDGRLLVAVHGRGPVSSAQEAALTRLGVRITSRLPRTRLVPAAGLVQAAVPATALDAVARLDWVVAVTPLYGDEPDVGPNLSEGVALHRADDVQDRGEDGTGVSVGVISDGVTSIADSVALGDLPSDVNVLDAGSGDEGTAMLEIVQDMAPGADLLFDGTGSGTADHAAALSNLVANGADVITEDIPFDAEPAFQRGLLAQTGDNIAAAGVPVHSSAGNLGARHSARVLAQGTGTTPDGTTFSGTPTGCSTTPDDVVAIAGAGDTTFDINTNSGGSVTLQWSEPRAIFPTAGQGGFTDLNLYLMNSTLTQCLAESVGVQASGVGDTLEQLSVGAMGAAKIVVDVQGSTTGTVPRLDLRWRGMTAVDTPTRAGALNPDSNYVGLATSAAARDAVGLGFEPFSAGGPSVLALTTQCPGGLPGPCGSGGAGGNAGTARPAWTAADGVDVSGVGGFSDPFFGTSASAPHAAACDALLRGSLDQPDAAPAATNARLALTATDLSLDQDTQGAGQLDCLAAVNRPPTVDAGGPYATDEGTDASLTAVGRDPDTGDSLTYAWDLDEDGQFDDASTATVAFDRVGQDGATTVAVRVTDEAGAQATDSAPVTVANVAPSITAATTGPIPEGGTTTLTGSVTDPGWLEDLTATVDWDDGAGSSPLGGPLEQARPLATLTLDRTHRHGDDGAFAAKACGKDDDAPAVCADAPVTVTNVAPSAVIAASSGTQDIGGEPTILTQAGQVVPFRGTSQDPGSDDLTLTWDWDDGAPAPDVSTTSLVNGPAADPAKSPTVQPRDLTDDQPHAFGEACAYDVAFASRDDDGGTTATGVRVLAVGTETKRQSEGWWHNEASRKGSLKRTTAEMVCRLAIARELSKVFDEARSAATLGEATLMLQPQPSTDARRQLDRALLTAWLNVADGSLPYITAKDVMASAEAVRLDAGATQAQLQAARKKVEALKQA